MVLNSGRAATAYLTAVPVNGSFADAPRRFGWRQPCAALSTKRILVCGEPHDGRQPAHVSRAGMSDKPTTGDSRDNTKQPCHDDAEVRGDRNHAREYRERCEHNCE